MSKSKRAQILIEPAEYEKLEAIARSKGVSVAALIRRAVRERYLSPDALREEALDEILGMEIPLGELADWSKAEDWLEEAHDAGLP